MAKPTMVVIELPLEELEVGDLEYFFDEKYLHNIFAAMFADRQSLGRLPLATRNNLMIPVLGSWIKTMKVTIKRDQEEIDSEEKVDPGVDPSSNPTAWDIPLGNS